MKREKIFSEGGYYSFIVKNNVVGHREAIAIVSQSVVKWLSPEQQSPIRVLDLACGGEPLTISCIMSRFNKIFFDYTGIDINPDQVAMAQRYNGYPANVRNITILQGNAWQLADLKLDRIYDLIYSGLNFHHATPEELLFLGKSLRPLLAPKGIVINHDIYRPQAVSYLRRPGHNPNNKDDVYTLVPPEVLSGIDLSELGIAEHAFGAQPYDWRQDFLKIYKVLLDKLKADQKGVQDILAHMACRDFPVSTDELCRIWSLVGLETEICDFHKTNHPWLP
ncbi:MAG: class I SAM-dependent methyltransferase [Elusimicrobia bacterium]|nr:class I SAM-dependent methyltransferase [Elusimicrobiota bacterium]